MVNKKKVMLLVCVFIIWGMTCIIIGNYFAQHFYLKITGRSLETEQINAFIEERSIRIISPENKIYDFKNVGVTYTIDLNVSSNFNVDSWWYTLIDLKHSGKTIYKNISFIPNTTINAVRGSNKLIVYANDTIGNMVKDSITFDVTVPNSAPIIRYISPEIYVCEGDYLSYYFNATDVDEDTPVPSITPTTHFYVAYSQRINLTTNSYEIFSGTLNKDNIGGVNKGWKTYEETVSVTDGEYVDYAQTNITIIEINNAPSIENIGVQTVLSKGKVFYKKIKVNDIENGDQDSGYLTFNITILNSTGNVVNLFDISSNGTMNFIANENDLGTYNVTLCVTDKGIKTPHERISDICKQDGKSITSCRRFSLTVTDENRKPTITKYFPVNFTLKINRTNNLYFNIAVYDPDKTLSDAYWYVDGVVKKYPSDIDRGFDEFIYNFSCDISSIHTVKVEVTDGILNDSIKWNLNITDSLLCPPSALDGGGRGGVLKAVCIEKWGCGYWSVCQNTEKSLEFGILSEGDYRVIKENCTLKGWDKEHCGFQTMNCFDLNYCNTTIKKPSEIQECYYAKEPSCYDGIKNCHDEACELLVDCGGPCRPCPTCSDKIKNQGEEGVDCGLPCGYSCRLEVPLAKKRFLRYILIITTILLAIVIITKVFKIFKIKEEIKNEKEA